MSSVVELPAVPLIIPTLSPARGLATLKYASANAGIGVGGCVIWDRDGQGFTRTVNAGLRDVLDPEEAPGVSSFLCLLNDDVRPRTRGWLRTLVSALLERPGAGFSGPSGPSRTPPMCWATGPEDAPAVTVAHLPGFCLVIRQEVVWSCGFLDEGFTHYGSDVELQIRSRAAGWSSVWVPSVWVDHELGEPIEPWWSEDQGRLAELMVEVTA